MWTLSNVNTNSQLQKLSLKFTLEASMYVGYSNFNWIVVSSKIFTLNSC